MKPQDESSSAVSFPPDFDLAHRIRSRAAACGISLPEQQAEQLALHARAVLRANTQLRLTSITEPEEFLERHLGEAFEGAAMLSQDVNGVLLDLGSGNGYPGVPLAAARPELRLVLAEASPRKAGFLHSMIHESGSTGAQVLERHVQRPADLQDLSPARVLTSRAMGGWAKVIPRLVSCLHEQGEILIWAGDEIPVIARREVWRKLVLEGQRPLPGRERSWIWLFRRRS